MTIEECRERLPQGWTEIIQRDPVLHVRFGGENSWHAEHYV